MRSVSLASLTVVSTALVSSYQDQRKSCEEMAVKDAPDRKGVKSEHFSSGEEFFVSMENKAKESEKEERRKAREAEKAAAEHSAKPPNNRERRKARKAERELAEQEHEKVVAQASEDLKQSALLSRMRVREARKARKAERELAEQEHEKVDSEQGHKALTTVQGLEDKNNRNEEERYYTS